MALRLSDKQKVSAAIAISLVFFLCELAIAYKTGSLALMADAFHYLNDLVGFVVTLVSIYMSDATTFRQDFSYGWQRARVLGAFFNGAFLFALGVSIFLQSIERFISVKEVNDVKLILIMGCVGLGLNIVMVLFLHDHHHHHREGDLESGTVVETGQSSVCMHPGSQVECRSKGPAHLVDVHADHRHATHSAVAPGRDLGMLGALLHVVGDALNNIGVIVAALVIWFTSSPARFYADPAVGMAISLMILVSAVPLVKHSGEILLQSAPRGVRLSDVKHDMEKIPGILSVHELHVWRLDQHKAVASAHVVVADADLAAFAARARAIGRCLHAYGIHSATLQPELSLAQEDEEESLGSGSGPASGSASGSASVGRSPGEGEAGEGAGSGDDDGEGSEVVTVSTATATAATGPGVVECRILCGEGDCGRLMCCRPGVRG